MRLRMYVHQSAKPTILRRQAVQPNLVGLVQRRKECTKLLCRKHWGPCHQVEQCVGISGIIVSGEVFDHPGLCTMTQTRSQALPKYKHSNQRTQLLVARVGDESDGCSWLFSSNALHTARQSDCDF